MTTRSRALVVVMLVTPLSRGLASIGIEAVQNYLRISHGISTSVDNNRSSMVIELPFMND